MTNYPHLFSPLQIGNITLRNRIVQTAHVKLYSERGVDSARSLAYHVERAKGGVALIIAGNRFVHPTSAGIPSRFFTWSFSRDAITADRRITRAVKDNGTAMFAQLNHLGTQSVSDSSNDLRVLWAPSAVKSPVFGETPKPMGQTEINEVIAWWGRSAECTREGGFDGVEIHMAHSYLLHQFLSPLYNKRSDEYGGSFENRIRLAREVVGAVRHRIGRDYIVGVRISLSDFIDGGLTIRDAIMVAQTFETSGLIDYVNVSAAGYHNAYLTFAPSDVPDGWLVDLAAEVKQAMRALPLLVAGGIRQAAQADDIIARERADMVAMTRAQIADPEFAVKSREGREDEIYHCIRINQGCVARANRGLPIGCTVNPTAGRERKFGAGTLIRTHHPVKWVVVGGGPAGMKAAEGLAERGHQVVLLEKEPELGGQVNLILKTPGRETFVWLTRDLDAQIRRHGVEVRLNTEATAELIRDLAPEAAVIATGSAPSRTGYSIVAPLVDQLPGVQQENVLTVWDALLNAGPIGDRVVVLDDDGTRCSAGTAEVLLNSGKKVTLVTRFSALFPFTAPTLDQAILYQRLFANGLKYRVNCWARAIEGRSIVIYDLYGGREERLEDVDTVILATGQKANDRLYYELEGRVPSLYRIGDCVAPRRLDHAIYEGFLAGRELWSAADRYIAEGELEEWDAHDVGELAGQTRPIE